MKMNERHYLVTSIIPESQDLSGKNLILGPWCLLNQRNKELLSKKEYILLPSPWAPGIQVKEASDYCIEVYEWILPVISDYLNSVHKTTYPVRYWRIIIGPWLFHFVDVLYERYKRLEHAVSLFPDLYTYIAQENTYHLASLDTTDFIWKAANSDAYNFQLFSMVIKEIFPSIGIESHIGIEESRKNKPYSVNLKTKILNMIASKVFYGDRIVLADMYHLSNIDKLIFGTSRLFRRINFIDGLKIQLNLDDLRINPDLRKPMVCETKLDIFRSFICKIMADAIPISFIEGYQRYKKYVSLNKGLSRAKIIGSAVGWYSREPFKFLAAQAVLNGTKLIEFQHGGFGFYSTISNECLSLDKDIFYSWGQASSDYGAVKKMPSIHLSGISGSYSAKTGKILFVGTSMAHYHYRFQSALQPDDMQKYFTDQSSFIRNMDIEARPRLLFRAYVSNYRWDEKSRIKKEYPEIKFADKKRAPILMQNAGLVIIDHPHTSFIEALSINVPSVFYWDHDVYLMRSEAEPYFELLRRAGILYKKPEEAAMMVNRIYKDPLEWWMKEEVQKARNTFCSRYAHADKNWRKIWADELLSISE